jgi:hypothetical protein
LAITFYNLDTTNFLLERQYRLEISKTHFKNQVPLALANILILELISEFYVVGCIELLINNGNGFYGAVFLVLPY